LELFGFCVVVSLVYWAVLIEKAVEARCFSDASGIFRF